MAMSRRVRWGRDTWLGVVYLLGGGLILAVGTWATSDGLVSKFTYLDVRQEVEHILVTVPAKESLWLLGGLCILLALVQWFWRERVRNVAMGTVATVVVAAFLIWITRGQALNLPGIVQSALTAATPLTLGAICGIFCERSGIINIAIEGMMLSGALSAAAIFGITGNPWLGLLAAMLTGGVMAALHAVLSIKYKVDQIVSGTVINILAVGATRYINLRLLEPSGLSAPGTIGVLRIPVLSRIPIIGPLLFSNQPLVYVMLLLVPLVHVLLFYTPWGLRTRACGEHPRAADTVGIHVNRMRYMNVLIGGLIAGLGGAHFSLGEVGSFEDGMTNGQGFVALAAMIFGNWNPIGSFLASLLFGFADAVQVKMQILKVGIPPEFLQMVPYVLTIVVLAGVVGRVFPPAAEGKPYEKQ